MNHYQDSGNGIEMGTGSETLAGVDWERHRADLQSGCCDGGKCPSKPFRTDFERVPEADRAEFCEAPPAFTEADSINPNYYKAGGLECIDYIEASLSNTELTPFQAYLVATIEKYAFRLGKKGAALKDAKKLAWYANRLVGQLEKSG
jgi:hypothetical protein